MKYIFPLLATFTAFAANADLADCVDLADDTERLACFDLQASQANEPTQEVSSERKSEAPARSPKPSLWIKIDSKDDFTNKETSWVYLNSDMAHVSMSDAPEAIVVRCDGNGGSEVYVRSGGYIGGRNNRIPVRYKFGDGEPISETWQESTNGRAAFLPAGYRDFKTGLLSGEGFVFELSDYRGVRYVARFPETSLGSDFDYVFGGCAD